MKMPVLDGLAFSLICIYVQSGYSVPVLILFFLPQCSGNKQCTCQRCQCCAGYGCGGCDRIIACLRQIDLDAQCILADARFLIERVGVQNGTGRMQAALPVP